MPYLYTGKIGTANSQSSSRFGFVKLASRYGSSGVRMNANLRGPILATYTMNANLYPNKTTLSRTMDAALIPLFGVYLSTSSSASGVVTIEVYQGSVSGGAIATQKLYRYNPTSGTTVLVVSTTRTTFSATDAAAPLGVAFYYILKSFNSSGAQIAYTTSSAMTLTGFTDWYLTRASSDPLAVQVSDSTATVVRQAEEFSPISAPYKVVAQGDVVGRRGSIEVVIESSNRDLTYSQLRSFKSELGQVYLKSPFGDVYAVDIGEMAVEFVGVGNLKVTIPFVENAVV